MLLAILLDDFVTRLYHMAKLPYAAAHIAARFSRITNVAFSDFSVDILE